MLRDVLKALKSATFQAGGNLLAALGCSDAEQHQYMGLIKVGDSCRGSAGVLAKAGSASKWPACLMALVYASWH